MSNNRIQIIGDELWYDGLKVGTLHQTIPSVDAAIKAHLTHLLKGAPVREWQP
jgi:hypothetical protein